MEFVNESIAIRTIGRPGAARRRAGALVLLGGSVLVGALTLAGVPTYGNLLVLGAVVVLAWLVDGSSQRYLGPGLVALAAGLGITIGKELGVEPYEHTLVYGGFGLALLVVSYFNPKAVRASGAFLLFTGITVAITTWVVSIPLGWELALILAAWGIYGLVRLRDVDDAPARPEGTQDERVPAHAGQGRDSARRR